MKNKIFLISLASLAMVMSGCGSTPKYEITWKNDDGSVLKKTEVEEGSMPVYDGTPTKADTEQYHYTFTGWEPALVKASADATYVAKYSSSVREYTVTWKNADGSILEKDENVPYGETPSYDGAIPTLAKDAQYTYDSFKGWDKEASAVHGDQVYVATYNTTLNKYNITWNNWDDTELEKDLDVEYGTVPTYDGADPTKDPTPETVYSWNGWDPKVDPVTGETTYTAHFDEAIRKYTFKFVDASGTAIEGASYADIECTVDPATVFDKENPEKINEWVTYDFDGWQKKTQDEETITFEPKYKAITTKDDALTYVLINDDTEYRVVNGSTSAHGSYKAEDLVIPEEHDGKPVTEIGSNAFYTNYYLKRIVIPKSVKLIRSCAFQSCSYVESILIKGATSLESYAFYGVNRLKSFEIVGDTYEEEVDGVNVTKPVAYTFDNYAIAYAGTEVPAAQRGTVIKLAEGLGEISQYCFYYSYVTSVNIPDTVKKIRYDAFYYSRYLEEVKFGENPSVAEIEGYAFYMCDALKSIELPETLVKVGDYILSYCALESIVIPDALASIGTGAFGYCRKMTHAKIGAKVTIAHMNNSLFQECPIEEYEVSEDNAEMKAVDGVVYSLDGTILVKYNCGAEGDFVIPSDVVSMSVNAFSYAKKLGKVTVPEGVTTIPSNCFSGSSLSAIVLPESLTTVQAYAFVNTNITSLALGKNVSSFNANCVNGCKSLTSITVDPENTTYAIDNDVMYNPTKTVLYFALAKKTGDFEVPASVTSIGAFAFNSSKLSSVTMGNNVTTLGGNCFSYFEGEITLGTGIEVIPTYCFSSTQFKDGEFTIPSSVTTIKDHAFQYSNIKTVSLPDACVTLEASSFYTCKSLTSVDLNKVEILQDYSFYEADEITKIVIPDTCTQVGYCSLAYMSKLEEVEIGAVKKICDSAFIYDYALKKVTMDDNIEEIGKYVFYYDQKLEDLNLPSKLKYLDDNAIYYCTSLDDTLTIPKSIKQLATYCLYYLKTDTVNFDGTKAEWDAIGSYTYDQDLHHYVGRASNWQYGIKHVVCTDQTIDL